MDYSKLLRSKGFILNSYPEGKFWELVVEDSEKQKEHICSVFKADIDLYVHGADIETLILQCAEDFTRCIFYYDCNSWDVYTEEWIKCVEQI